MNTVGRHVLVELYDCDRAIIDDVAHVTTSMRQAAEAVGATIVSEAFHRYAPQGVSGILLISESHLSVHTWPEAGYVAVDIFTCGGLDPMPGVRLLERRLGARDVSVSETLRGLPEEVARARAADRAARRE